MYTYEEQCVMDLSDNYTVLYSFLGRALIDAAGVEGERALREGTRRYGRDRGECSRRQHLALGVKINMQSLFSVGGDLPPDPRFHRELQELNPEEPGVPHPGVPHGGHLEGLWGAGDRPHVLRRVPPRLLQPLRLRLRPHEPCKDADPGEDEYCAFNVVLRAENLPDELKPLCFAQYDPATSPPR